MSIAELSACAPRLSGRDLGEHDALSDQLHRLKRAEFVGQPHQVAMLEEVVYEPDGLVTRIHLSSDRGSRAG
jgi:hypothetical protein